MLQNIFKFCDEHTLWRIGKGVALGAGITLGVVAACKAAQACANALTSKDRSFDKYSHLDANALKEEGNKFFKEGKFVTAKELYTQAIQRSDGSKDTLAVYHQNRAAACSSLEQWEDVIKDCDAAITFDHKYIKAYGRRATANLKLGWSKLALYDAAIAFYLSAKKTKPATKLFQQTLELYCMEKAAKLVMIRQPVPLDPESLREYYSNFPHDPIISSLENISAFSSDWRSPFHLALQAFKNKDYERITPLLGEEIEAKSSSFLMESLLFRATLHTVAGYLNHAADDLDRLLVMENVPARILSTALLRRGLLHIASMDTEKGLAEIDSAAVIDPYNADVFHQRGQMALMMKDFTKCAKESSMAVRLAAVENSHFLLQLYTCDLQVAQQQDDGEKYTQTLSQLEKLCDKYEQVPETWCVYGQALVMCHAYEMAELAYAQAIERCSSKSKIYIQFAALVLGWRKDQDKALELLNKAIALDPHNNIILENLGHIYLNQGKLDQAIEVFSKSLQYCRTIAAAVNACGLVETVKIQLEMKEKFSMDVKNFYLLMNPSCT